MTNFTKLIVRGLAAIGGTSVTAKLIRNNWQGDTVSGAEAAGIIALSMAGGLAADYAAKQAVDAIDTIQKGVKNVKEAINTPKEEEVEEVDETEEEEAEA